MWGTRQCLAVQVTCPSLLAEYEQLLAPEEHAHVMAAGSAALRKERLLARVLVRTTLSRWAFLLPPRMRPRDDRTTFQPKMSMLNIGGRGAAAMRRMCHVPYIKLHLGGLAEL